MSTHYTGVVSGDGVMLMADAPTRRDSRQVTRYCTATGRCTKVSRSHLYTVFIAICRTRSPEARKKGRT
jgi:hypothetical protein